MSLLHPSPLLHHHKQKYTSNAASLSLLCPTAPKQHKLAAQQSPRDLAQPGPTGVTLQQEEGTAAEETESDAEEPVASTSGQPNHSGLFELYRTSVRIIVYSTAIVLGMASSSILGTWLRCACFLTITMGLSLRDTWGMWEKYAKPKRIAPHSAMLDACTVLFVGANAVSIGWISSSILEFVGNILGFWLLCSLHFDGDSWPLDQRRQRPQQPRQGGAGAIALSKGEFGMVFSTVICACISVGVAVYLMDQYCHALASEELVAGIARKAAAAAIR